MGINDLNKFFKGIIDVDDKAVVICDTEHTIVYMNPAAVKQYSKRGGSALVGRNLLDCHNPNSCSIIRNNLERMKNDTSVNKIFETHGSKPGTNDDIYMVAIRDDEGNLIGYYEKFEDKNLYKEN